jgi:WD40 repeat protein
MNLKPLVYTHTGYTDNLIKRLIPAIVLGLILCGIVSFATLLWLADSLDPAPKAEVCANATLEPETPSFEQSTIYKLEQTTIPIRTTNAKQLTEIQHNIGSSRPNSAVRLSMSADGKNLNVDMPYQPSSVVFHPDGKTFFYLSYGMSSPSYINICDIETRDRMALIEPENMNKLLFSPNGKLFAVNQWWGIISLYDASSYELITTLNVQNKDNRDGLNSVYSSELAFNPDGTMLVFASDDHQTDIYSIRVWDLKTYQELAVLSGHKQKINELVFGSNVIASSSDDGTIRLWGVPG